MQTAWRMGLCLLLVLVAGCSGRSTLSGYFVAVDELVSEMNGTTAALVADYEAAPQSVERAQVLLEGFVQARGDFLDQYRDLAPPDQANDLHAIGIEVITAMKATEENLAARVASATSVAELNQLWRGDEYAAVIAANERASIACQEMQAVVDATDDRSQFSDVPWLPPEMKEVVEVLFGCTVP